MRILKVCSVFYPAYAYGGPVAVAYMFSQELVKRGHKVIVLSSNSYDAKKCIKRTYAEINGVKVYYFPNLSNYLAWNYRIFTPLSMILAMESFVKKTDIIHMHDFRTIHNIAAYRCAKRYKKPYIVQAHGSILTYFQRGTLKIIYDKLWGFDLLFNASKIFVLNKFEFNQCKQLGIPDEKIEIVPNPIDLNLFKKMPERGYFRRKYKIPLDSKVILYLGRIHKIKGVDILVKAFAYLIREKHLKDKDILLVIAGPDDGYLKYTKMLVSYLNIDKYVLFTGPLYGQTKIAAYVDADICVFPSRYETFPVTLLEVYACGKPVIASSVGGLIDLVINGKTGVLVEPGNERSLMRAISFLINNPELIKKMGDNGKEYVKKFDIKKIVERLEKIYKNITG